MPNEKPGTSGRIAAALQRERLLASSDSEPQPAENEPAGEPVRLPDEHPPTISEPEDCPLSPTIVLKRTDSNHNATLIRPVRRDRKARHVIFLVMASSAIAALMCWIGWTYGQKSIQRAAETRRPSTLGIRSSLRQNGNQLVLDWESAHPAFRQVTADVFDGDTVHHVDLTTAFQQQNSVVITHSTGNVQVVITTVDGSGHSMKQTAGFADSAAVAHDMSLATQKAAPPTASSDPKPTRSHRARRHYR
ncbi:MAG TPA: hypothetical protein VFA65_00725 [Bryobacteraceae bacterium]|nr:hypothetical protein [Bryobacteraceae bacterium]